MLSHSIFDYYFSYPPVVSYEAPRGSENVDIPSPFFIYIIILIKLFSFVGFFFFLTEETGFIYLFI